MSESLIKEFRHTGIIVKNMEKSRRFYEDILGLDRNEVISKLEARFDIEIGTSIDLIIQRSGESEPIKTTVVTDEIIVQGSPITTANISEIELEKIIKNQKDASRNADHFSS